MSRDVKADFNRQTADHELSVLKDDGLYRHLRCQQPGTWIYGFDVVTWPGYLAIVGDCGDFVFSRIRDMFDFFGGEDERYHPGGINPDYWSQKLQAPRPDKSREFSHEAFRRRMLEWADSQADDDGWGYELLPYRALMREAVEREVFHVCETAWRNADRIDYVGWERHYDVEHHARERMQELAEADVLSWDDVSEWDLREYDFQFLWCCHAIVWAIQHYRELVREPVAA